MREFARDLTEVVGLCVEALFVRDGAVVQGVQLREAGEGEGVAVGGGEGFVVGGDEGCVEGVRGDEEALERGKEDGEGVCESPG